jgi:hypothetical protein
MNQCVRVYPELACLWNRTRKGWRCVDYAPPPDGMLFLPIVIDVKPEDTSGALTEALQHLCLPIDEWRATIWPD